MTYTRAEALKRIRDFLVTNTRNGETTCQAAARLGIFCHGYDHWTTQRLRELYPWLAKKLPAESPREELLKLIVAWDGARTLVHNVSTTCEAKSLDHEGCMGFEKYSNEQLKRIFPQIFQTDDQITPW